ncbi:MAG: ATP-binding protein [Candidatus Nitrosotenuis sp.]
MLQTQLVANRKYLNRDGDKSKNPDDALKRPDKEIYLKNTTNMHTTDTVELGYNIKEVNDYLNSLSKHIAEQKERIEQIKNKQSSFEKELDILKVGQPVPVEPSSTEFESLGKEFESDKIIDDINAIVEREVQNRIMVLESQLQEEKKNSAEFKRMLEQNLRKFNKIEKSLVVEKTVLESEVKEITQKLIQAERLSAMGELASRLAHDMRNPLSAIKGTVQLIKKTSKNMDESTLRRIDLIEKSIFRMTHQIDGVLDYVKETPLNKKPSSLNEIIISALQTLMIPSNVTINFPKDDVVLLCDSHKIEIMFANMILNAIQAIGDGKGTINIRAKKQQNDILIKIEDTGPGIPASIIGKIFDPLFTTKQEGTGLGLASCKSIVEQHKGTISVSNNPTTFSISLPFYT